MATKNRQEKMGPGNRGSGLYSGQRAEGWKLGRREGKGFADRRYRLEAEPAFVRGFGLEFEGMGFSQTSIEATLRPHAFIQLF